MNLSGGLTGRGVIEPDLDGQMKALVVIEGFSTRRIGLPELLSVVHVTAENQANIGGMAGGAAVGLLLAGPLGALVGAWLKSGAKASQIAIIQLIDGTSAVAQMSAVELGTLLSAMPRAEQLRAEAERLRLQTDAEASAFAQWAQSPPDGDPPSQDFWAFMRADE